MPVLTLFCQTLSVTHSNAEARDHTACFLMLGRIVSMILRSERMYVDRSVLQHRVQLYLARFIALFGEDAVVPKFHMLFHIATYPKLLNCIVHERKHKSIKKYGNIHFNLQKDWDRSVLREVTCDRLARLLNASMVQWGASCELDGGTEISKRAYKALAAIIGHVAKDRVKTALRVRINQWEKVSVKDVVQIGAAAPPILGKIKRLLSITHDSGTQVVAIVDELTVLSEHTLAWKCARGAGLITVDAAHIQTALLSGGGASGPMTVLRPWRLTDPMDI